MEEKKCYYYVDSLGEIWLHKSDVENICHPGPNDDDVEAALSDEKLSRQFDAFSDEELRKAVIEIGVEKDEAETMSRDTLISYVVWDVAYDLLDDEESDFHKAA